MKDEHKKIILVGGGVSLAGIYLLSKRGEDSFAGGMGDLIGRPLDALNIPAGGGEAGADPTPAETISDIFAGLPEMPIFSEGGMGGRMPMGMPLIDEGGGAPSSKKAFSISRGLTGLSGLASKAIITGAKVPVYGVMRPTQLLAGTAAILSTRAYNLVATDRQQRRHEAAQRRRVRQYPRSSHAVSMLTGGVTARAPVTKKQLAARERYPTTYKVWKGLFGWLGA